MDEQLAVDINRVCRLTGSFTLRSGQTATEYFDKYLFESDPQLIRRVAEAMVPLLPDRTELLGGLELGWRPNRDRPQPADRTPGFVRAKGSEDIRDLAVWRKEPK
jgi:orotate phosphoribosyltransferase